MSEFLYTSKYETDTSTAISVLAHNNYDDELFIRFKKGNEVIYSDVAESTFNLFTQADSLGRFYNQHIQGKFDSESPETYWSGATELLPVDKLGSGSVDASILNDVGISSASVYPYVGDLPPVSPDFGTWTTIETSTRAPKSRYDVHWEHEDGTQGGKLPFEAVDEADAIRQFNEAATAAMPFTGVSGYKITAVTHYID